MKEDAGQVPAFDQKERPGNRRMATLGCLYTVDRHVRTAEQIVATLFRDDTVSQPENRPEPVASITAAISPSRLSREKKRCPAPIGPGRGWPKK